MKTWQFYYIFKDYRWCFLGSLCDEYLNEIFRCELGHFRLNLVNPMAMAATLASQPASSYNLSFIISSQIVIMTMGWGLFVGLAAESCSGIWLQCLSVGQVDLVASAWIALQNVLGVKSCDTMQYCNSIKTDLIFFFCSIVLYNVRRRMVQFL